MLKIKKRNDLYILTLVADDYSFLSGGQVVGTIDVNKFWQGSQFTYLHKGNNMKSASD